MLSHNCTMKLYVDDKRIPKEEGWVWCLHAETAIKFLSRAFDNNFPTITHISLDHDMGEERPTGYDVLLWIEEKVINEDYDPPKIIIHTANPSARKKMELAKRKIEKMLKNEN